MIAEMNDPIFKKVLALPAWPSCQPRPMAVFPSALATIGLMTSVVNELISVLNARATTSPTATTITSPRKRKFLNPRMSCPPTVLAVNGWCSGTPNISGSRPATQAPLNGRRGTQLPPYGTQGPPPSTETGLCGLSARQDAMLEALAPARFMILASTGQIHDPGQFGPNGPRR